MDGLKEANFISVVFLHLQNNYPWKQNNKVNQFTLHYGIQNEFSRYILPLNAQNILVLL